MANLTGSIQALLHEANTAILAHSLPMGVGVADAPVARFAMKTCDNCGTRKTQVLRTAGHWIASIRCEIIPDVCR